MVTRRTLPGRDTFYGGNRTVRGELRDVDYVRRQVFRVVAGEGTGIVHSAPGCGDVDHLWGIEHKIVAIAPLVVRKQ